MDNSWILFLIGGLFVVLVGFMIVAGRKHRQQIVPDYRAMFVLGIVFLPLGIPSGNWGLSVMGAAFLVAGIRHRDKWGKHTRWADYPPERKRMKIFFLSALAILALATAAFGNEVEDRTLANLTLAPIPRWQIVIPKLLAAVSVSAPFIAISALVTSHLAFNADATATFAVTVSTLVGLALYACLFVFLGLATSQAIGVGLLYIVLWEGFFSNFVSGVRLFSIRS